MTNRKKWAVYPGLLALGAAAILLSAVSGGSTPQGRAPQQPIVFPHNPHVVALQMNCLYCHNAANKSPDPGLPAIGTCMGCHLVIGPRRPDGTQRPEVAKLQQFASKNQPIPWIRIHKVPDYVQFPHMRHVNAGVTCQTCHGPVQDMLPVYQAQSLNMGWCVNCHIQRQVRYDCSVCHH